MTSEAHLMDCMEYMRSLPDNFADLCLVDPPYGIGAAKEKPHNGWKDHGIKEWDNKSPDESYFTELFRVSKNQIIWGANHFISKMPFNSPAWIIWDKGQRDFSLADGEMAWTSFDRAMRIFTYARAKSLSDVRIHATQKPVALYSWIYANYLPQGGKVFDSHLGSGSNRIAADKAGNIDFYATDIDADYFNSQEKRWRQYKSAPVMVFPERISPVQTDLF